MSNSLEQRTQEEIVEDLREKVASLELQILDKRPMIRPARLGIREAARYVGLAEKTLRNRISRDDGTFPRPRRDGGKVLFRVSDLDAYLEVQE